MFKKPKAFALATLFLLTLTGLSLAIGPRPLDWSHVLDPLSTDRYILMTSRLPRTISIIIAGASLSLAGLLAQTLTQNRFASPGTMGTVASARLGLVVALLCLPSASLVNRSIVAFLFSLAGTLLFIRVIDRIQLKENMMVAVIGLIYGNIIQALGTYLAIQYDLSQQLTAWLQGSFASLHSDNFQLIFVSLLALILTVAGSHYFAVLGLGRDLATELGIPFERIRLFAIALIAFASSAVLLTAGNIPFVGIVIPNLVSFMQGDHFRKNIGAVLLVGPIFLLLCDILSRLLIHPYEIPVALVVGILGSLLFIFLLLKGEAK